MNIELEVTGALEIVPVRQSADPNDGKNRIFPDATTYKSTAAFWDRL